MAFKLTDPEKAALKGEKGVCVWMWDFKNYIRYNYKILYFFQPHPLFFAPTITISNDQTLILDIIQIRRRRRRRRERENELGTV